MSKNGIRLISFVLGLAIGTSLPLLALAGGEMKPFLEPDVLCKVAAEALVQDYERIYPKMQQEHQEALQRRKQGEAELAKARQRVRAKVDQFNAILERLDRKGIKARPTELVDHLEPCIQQDSNFLVFDSPSVKVLGVFDRYSAYGQPGEPVSCRLSLGLRAQAGDAYEVLYFDVAGKDIVAWANDPKAAPPGIDAEKVLQRMSRAIDELFPVREPMSLEGYISSRMEEKGLRCPQHLYVSEAKTNLSREATDAKAI